MAIRSSIIALAFLSCTASGFAQAVSADAVSIDVLGADGAKLGTASLTDAPRGVLLKVELKGLPPGWHGMHFHEKGDCGDPKFMNSGAHVHAATPVVHGLLNAEANDLGDLPNLYVAADGSAVTEVFSTLVSLKGAGGRPALLDEDGSALVIHASPDDFKTQPIGGSGARIACGAIK